MIRSDLDWIVMKTLEKDRSRRYESVSELSADIERHLNDEAVLAGKASTVYKIQKFVRRNKTLCVSFATVLTILLAALAFSYTAFISERNARIGGRLIFRVDPGMIPSTVFRIYCSVS